MNRTPNQISQSNLKKLRFIPLFQAGYFIVILAGNNISNQANKADLLCMFASTKQPIIVEIKTDNESFKDKQLKNYIKNASNWQRIVSGISSVSSNKNTKTDYRLKYFATYN